MESGKVDRFRTQVRDSGNSGEVAGDYQKSSRRSAALAYGLDLGLGDRTSENLLCHSWRRVASAKGRRAAGKTDRTRGRTAAPNSTIDTEGNGSSQSRQLGELSAPGNPG
ncbi:hypothetical protein IT6_02720 [Methylacidiphilum caldifontis]|uniref:hypothetical protein n=1 Tax=Methylacidiphilum caldifontis TaxID=2795386 RepID=UPI001A8E3BE2|nr:hypothetical protein [Methylacidiphilum caldifontis]QSR89216.1 hypothetical protein IT6_02720 [Methylacidiphilum caldifontis]